jgi:hypothetical protein
VLSGASVMGANVHEIAESHVQPSAFAKQIFKNQTLTDHLITKDFSYHIIIELHFFNT